ncbi:MAG: membrane protein insertion efficiency factor YidD [Alphaproteobacteria bacterium]
MSLVANMAGLALRGLIRIYQLLISPVLPAHCRYAPSCSAYALEALRSHGVARGGVMALRRILRCHPWGDHGFDPVPTSAQQIRRSR